MLQAGELIREGRTKKIYATEDPEQAIAYFKDEAMAYHGLKRGRILGKGEVNNAVCKTFFELLGRHGIENHFIRQIDSCSSLIRRCDMIPVAIKVRNRAAGEFAQRLGLSEGMPLHPPVVELLIRDDTVEDPLINMTHVLALRLATRDEIDQAIRTALKVNEIISAFMREISVEVIDFKLEFGRFHGKVLVADEISPDVARFWDARTHEPMDIDRFRRDLGNVEQAYQELLQRMMGIREAQQQ